MPDPNGGWLNQPFSGAPSATNRDAMIARQIMAGQGVRPSPPTPEQLQRQRVRRWRRAVILAVIAVGFFVGTIADIGSRHQSYKPSLVLAIMFSAFAMYQVARAVGTNIP